MEPEAKRLNKIALLNRQPTLFRHGINAVNILPTDDDNDTIQLPPLMLEQYNGDFDGDEFGLFLIHDQKALQELEEKAHLKNVHRYDSDNKMICVPRHEALQACYILTENIDPNFEKEYLEIVSLSDLPEDFDYWNNELDKPIKINNKHFTYGVCLLNKWMGFETVQINYTITKKEVNDISEIMHDSFEDYPDKLGELNKKLLFFISSTNHCPTINIEEMINILNEESENLFKKLPKKNPYIGFHINEGLVNRCINHLDKKSDLYKLYKSGSRFSKQQLASVCINIGYVADANNIVVKEPICTNLLKGLDEETYFRTAPGARKGIVDKSDVTPDSGYLERTLTMALSPVELEEEDCDTSNYLDILVFSKNHAKTLVGKYYRDPYVVSSDWSILDYKTAISFINKKIYIRSPMTCETPHFKICEKCFGSRKFPTKFVGIISGQLIAERITQLVMRSFHHSGSAIINTFDSVKEYIENNLVDIEENGVIKLKFKNNYFPSAFKDIPGFKSIEPENNIIVFDPIEEEVENTDVISVFKKVNNLLKTHTGGNPTEYYLELMENVLSVGTPYSSFVEILLCNMFLVDSDPKLFWRYNQHKDPVKKLGAKGLAGAISPTLGCLYQPNRNTLKQIVNFDNTNLDTMSIYEKIWYGVFD